MGIVAILFAMCFVLASLDTRSDIALRSTTPYPLDEDIEA